MDCGLSNESYCRAYDRVGSIRDWDEASSLSSP